MSENLEDLVRISPPDWPEKQLDVHPGDLSKYAYVGLGLGVPMVMLPWDNLETAAQRPGYYGAQLPTADPFHNAPTNDDTGGVVYFGGRPAEADITSLLRLLSVRGNASDYAAYVADSNNVSRDRYLTQLRIVSRFALQYMFGAIDEQQYEQFQPQQLTTGELIWRFILHQQQTWGSGYSRALDGVMGGDGDWAKETLAFGFMVENAYHGVYRIWSRAWLVTK